MEGSAFWETCAESLNQRWGELISDPSFKNKVYKEKHRCLMNEIRKDPDAFILFHRLTITQFEMLAYHIQDDLKRLPLSPAFSLSLALGFLSNDPIITFPFEVIGLGLSDLPPIIDKVYKAVVKVLKREVFTRLTMKDIDKEAKKFDEMWNFPKCYGAVEYRRILCESRTAVGNTIENENYVAVVCAVSDAYCRFNSVRMSTLPSQNDDGYPYLLLRKPAYLSNGYLHYMSRLPVEIYDSKDYVTVGSLDSDLTWRNMRPYEMPVEDEQQSIFNNRLERAKSVVDNAFGILFKRWRIFQSPLPIEKGRLWRIVQCAVLLHNWLITDDLEPGTVERNYLPEGLFVAKNAHNKLVPGYWAEFSITAGVQPLRNLSRLESSEGEQRRSQYASQFTTEGQHVTASTSKAETDHDENKQPALQEKD